MPYRVDWLIEDEILLYVFWGAMVPDDLRGAFIEMIDLMNRTQNNSIHTISDITQITHYVTMHDSMKIVREYRQQMETNGWSITVGELDVFTKMGIAVSRSLMKRKSTSFDTMDEAITHLKENDANLHWDEMNTEFLAFSTSDKK